MRIRASKIKVIDDRLTYNDKNIGPADEFKWEQMKHSSLAHRYNGDLDE